MVTPSLNWADSEIMHEIDVYRRKCKFGEENISLLTFKTYSQQACLLECRTMKAFEKCGCIPWNYPQVKGNKTCSGFQTQHCFQDTFNHFNKLECECPLECNRVKYTYWVDAQKIDAKNDLEPYK